MYVRFRVAADATQVMSPTGEAETGEVEDYVLMSLGDTIWLDDGAGANKDNGEHRGVCSVRAAGIEKSVQLQSGESGFRVMH